MSSQQSLSTRESDRRRLNHILNENPRRTGHIIASLFNSRFDSATIHQPDGSVVQLMTISRLRLRGADANHHRLTAEAILRDSSNTLLASTPAWFEVPSCCIIELMRYREGSDGVIYAGAGTWDGSDEEADDVDPASDDDRGSRSVSRGSSLPDSDQEYYEGELYGTPVEVQLSYEDAIELIEMLDPPRRSPPAASLAIPEFRFEQPPPTAQSMAALWEAIEAIDEDCERLHREGPESTSRIRTDAFEPMTRDLWFTICNICYLFHHDRTQLLEGGVGPETVAALRSGGVTFADVLFLLRQREEGRRNRARAS